MKVLACMLVILALVAGVAAPASAFDARSFYDDLARQSGGIGGGD